MGQRQAGRLAVTLRGHDAPVREASLHFKPFLLAIEKPDQGIQGLIG